jgi:GNAT superfamily N-acetyltransferase
MIYEATSHRGAICARVLATLPQWFGIPESNEAYRRDVESMPMFVAREEADEVGFIALKRQTPFAMEIHVLGVQPSRHRQGIGRALVQRARSYSVGVGARFLTVKTRSPSRPDQNYLRTLAFYEAVGFVPIEEFPLLWDAENPALMMLMVL